ncbi:MAG: glutamine synthetase III [Sphaerochaetaceae bacterium]
MKESNESYFSNNFGSLVFNDQIMRRDLSQEVYEKLKETIEEGKTLDLDIANSVANAMKNWAVEKGATHFTHWFQPLSGITAEKHESFIFPLKDGKAILKFSGKELIKGEPDASSFPSGGLRATFEARGYTAWDPTSYAFIKEKTLFIPTAFCSYSGQVLDKKTPLLKSMEVLNDSAINVLKLLGDEKSKRVHVSVGLEQEYFLIDQKIAEKRKDLKLCGRTLIGAAPARGQELEDHYFGTIKSRVSTFMKELDVELWKLGIYAKTRHNEVAPAQHELASIYTTANLSVDQNLIVMDMMKRIANKMDLVCLLHEKPFEGLNGSGKHNNWSLCTDRGVNLFELGVTPSDNARFMLFIAAMIRAVDKYQDLLRFTVASASNDHRLGAAEAPPAIVSVYLGEELDRIFREISIGKEGSKNKETKIELSVHVLPEFPKDISDRNRTSPLAFTGNKFEFRMLGSSFNASDSNTVLNTIFADSLNYIAECLKNKMAINAIISKIYKNHKSIIFNGNSYSAYWIEEAERRGLVNFKTTAEASAALIAEKNVRLFEDNKILTKVELYSRYEVTLEMYSKTIMIENQVLREMVKKDIMPAIIGYSGFIAENVKAKLEVSKNLNCKFEISLIEKLSTLINDLDIKLREIEESSLKFKQIQDSFDSCLYLAKTVIPLENELRLICDEAETIVANDYWPYPDYEQLLFSVK